MSVSLRAEGLRKAFQIEEMTPEEFAGRYSHLIGSSQFEFSHHEDPELHEWLERYGEILKDQSLLKSLRKAFKGDLEHQFKFAR